ncbi:Uncharacterised protein [Mycobacteroides abscessus subsp. abscessus]|nr:Uncharacterised protein [Mycobacteroides abscessus subsp. abscessus]
MWFVSYGDPILPISQVPTPPSSQMMAVANRKRATPAAAAKKPSTKAGTVLATRCPQLACSSGAKRTPSRPSVSRGRMPFSSRR